MAMKIIGLTGSIGMGKTVTAGLLSKYFHIPVFDADLTAHQLTKPITGAALPLIAQKFPNTVTNGVLNRNLLGNIIFEDPAKRRELQKILHPMIEQKRQLFLKTHRRLNRRFVVLDIPLLFETNMQAICDATILVHCSAFLQRQRVLKRPNMNPDKFKSIVKSQMPVIKKRHKAKYVITSGLGKANVFICLQKILNQE